MPTSFTNLTYLFPFPLTSTPSVSGSNRKGSAHTSRSWEGDGSSDVSGSSRKGSAHASRSREGDGSRSNRGSSNKKKRRRDEEEGEVEDEVEEEEEEVDQPGHEDDEDGDEIVDIIDGEVEEEKKKGAKVEDGDWMKKEKVTIDKNKAVSICRDKFFDHELELYRTRTMMKNGPKFGWDPNGGEDMPQLPTGMTYAARRKLNRYLNSVTLVILRDAGMRVELGNDLVVPVESFHGVDRRRRKAASEKMYVYFARLGLTRSDCHAYLGKFTMFLLLLSGWL